jgi:prepilin-type N-terminal cleavage/methylation domain-containing protein
MNYNRRANNMNCKRPEQASRRGGSAAGFTMAEMLTVIMIVGLIVAVSIPAFLQLFPQYRAKAAALEVSNYIGLARQNSITTRRPTKVSYDIANSRFAGYVLNQQIVDMDTATLNTTLAASANWVPVDNNFRTVSAVNWRVLSATNFLLSTANNFNDINGDGTRDIVFLSDGSVATTPDASAPGTPLSFSPLPEVVVAANSRLVKFNRYRIRLTPTGSLSIFAMFE